VREFAANQPMDEDDDQTAGSRAGSDEPPQRQDTMNTATPPQNTMTTASERIQVIIDAAEKAAAGIIEDAEVQARRYLDETRRRADELGVERAKAISDLTDSLISQAETVKRQSDDLISALDDAKGEIAARVEPQIEIAAPPTAQVSQLPRKQEPQLQAVHPVTNSLQVTRVEEALETQAPEPLRAAPDPTADRKAGFGGPIPASAKLLATQMAVAGSSRDEIETRLRSEYGIDDAGSMLDAILGMGA
jgi:hypothetical protein